jgi:hypothetical protein
VLVAGAAAFWVLGPTTDFAALLPGATVPEESTQAAGTDGAATGALDITSEPSGARITIDGTDYGVTPLMVPDLPVGRHTVRFESDAGTLERSVQVEAGVTASLVESIYAGFVAVFAPVQLEIVQEGRRIGTTEDGRLMLAPGTHRIELVSERLAYRAEVTLDVLPGEVTAHSVELPDGRLSITAEPWAEVTLDGEPAGRTPVADLAVTIGTRDVLFTHPELGERRERVLVTMAGPASLHVDLNR